jgi:hypothetical protein
VVDGARGGAGGRLGWLWECAQPKAPNSTTRAITPPNTIRA